MRGRAQEEYAERHEGLPEADKGPGLQVEPVALARRRAPAAPVLGELDVLAHDDLERLHLLTEEELNGVVLTGSYLRSEVNNFE